MIARRNDLHRWLLASILALLSGTANAQNVNPQAAATAQSLLEDAGALMDAGNFANACPKVERAAALVPDGIGAKMALAECYVGMKRLASAWGQYGRAEALAFAKGDSRAEEARAEANKLKPMLATVTIAVPDAMHDVAGLSITWDGLEQKQAVWGTPMPIDVGKHVVEVNAPGRQPWRREIVVESDGVTLEENIPVLEAVPVEKPKTAPIAEPVKVVVVPKPVASPPKWILPVGIVGLGVGAAGIIGGSVLGSLAASRFEESNFQGECEIDNFCNARGVALRDESLTFARGSTAAFIIGGAFTVAGGISVGLALRKKKESALRARANVQWTVDAAPAWIGLRGVW